MLMHSNSPLVSKEKVYSVAVPEKTNTYTPVSHAQIFDTLEDHLQKADLHIRNKSFALSKNEQRVFAEYSIYNDHNGHSPTIVIANGYDREMSLKIAAGDTAWVCDNLCIAGDTFKTIKAHRKDIDKDLNYIIQDAVYSVIEDHDQIMATFNSYKEIEVNQYQGWKILGALRGMGALTSKTFNIALEYFNNPLHKEHQDENLYGLYNACTEGLKGLNAADVFNPHSKFEKTWNNIIEAEFTLPQAV